MKCWCSTMKRNDSTRNTVVTSNMKPSRTSFVRAVNLIPCTVKMVMKPTVTAAKIAKGMRGVMR